MQINVASSLVDQMYLYLLILLFDQFFSSERLSPTVLLVLLLFVLPFPLILRFI